jgi:hypothetical protein
MDGSSPPEQNVEEHMKPQTQRWSKSPNMKEKEDDG